MSESTLDVKQKSVLSTYPTVLVYLLVYGANYGNLMISLGTNEIMQLASYHFLKICECFFQCTHWYFHAQL